MLVKDLMTKSVITINSDDTVLEACKRYNRFKIGCLVVMKDYAIVGIITERDIISKVIIIQRNPTETIVEEIMSEEIKTVLDIEPVEKAAEKMKMYKIKKLPVVTDSGTLVGIITISDVVNIIPDFLKKPAEEEVVLSSEDKVSVSPEVDV